jgi:hypothetical protein
MLGPRSTRRVAVVALLALDTGMHLAKNGELRRDRYSFGWSIISDVIMVSILWAGGFFG